MYGGSGTYYTSCDSGRHTAAFCRISVCCMHCKGITDHKTEKCLKVVKKTVRKRYLIPCGLCIESTDPERNDTGSAYSHMEKDCAFRLG